MIDFLLLMCVLVIFFMGVQIGASVGGIPSMIRWVAEKLEGWLKKDKKNE